MSLSLQMLSGIVGKQEKTLSRWCEAGLIPGAYRLRGGAVRRGKWRVRLPRVSKEDKVKAQYHAKRAGVTVPEYAAVCALERLADRIFENTRTFRRRAHRRRPVLTSSDMAVVANVRVINQRKLAAEMAGLATHRAAAHQPEGNLWADAFRNLGDDATLPLDAPSQAWRRPGLSHDLLELAYAKSRLKLQGSKAETMTLPMLCRLLGLSMVVVRNDARLAQLLQQQIYEANRAEGVGLTPDVATAPQEPTANKRSLKDFSPAAKKMHRKAAESAAAWLRSMTPDQRAMLSEDTFAHLCALAGKAKASDQL